MPREVLHASLYGAASRQMSGYAAFPKKLLWLIPQRRCVLSVFKCMSTSLAFSYLCKPSAHSFWSCWRALRELCTRVHSVGQTLLLASRGQWCAYTPKRESKTQNSVSVEWHAKITMYVRYDCVRLYLNKNFFVKKVFGQSELRKKA